MLTYPHVEDYLEYLAGYEVGVTGLINPANRTRISLARYDTQIVDSMANNTMFGTALTDRQGELAVKLILKYRRQFTKLGIDVASIENPVYRIPLRVIDRSKLIFLEENNKIAVKFPYDSDLIKLVQEYKTKSQGSVQFNKKNKTWYLGLTEYNINWVMAWGHSMEFEISPEIKILFDQIIECEKQPYEIKLIKSSKGYTITNAPSSLTDYIIQNLGGFGENNSIALLDHSGVLGYTVDDNIKRDQLIDLFGLYQRKWVESTEENLQLIYDYAALTNRYPICIYNPTLLDLDLSRFDDQDIVRFDRNGKTKTSDYDPYRVKVVYAQKIPVTWDFPVPLLLTTFQLMFGGRQTNWTQRAEKIIYYGVGQLKEDC